MAIDAGLVFAGLAILLTIIGMVGGLVWLVVSLTVSPIRQDVTYIKSVIGRVKSEDELKRMVQVEIHKHEKECEAGRPRYVQTETGTFRVVGTGPAAAGGK